MKVNGINKGKVYSLYSQKDEYNLLYNEEYFSKTYNIFKCHT